MVEIVEADECAAQKQESLVDVRRPLVAERRHQAGFRTSSWVRASETSLAPASVSAPTRSPHYTSVSSTRVSSAKRARKRSAYGWAFWESGVGADATAVHQVSSSHHLQPRASSPAARRKVLCQGPLGITRGLELSQPRGRAVPRARRGSLRAPGAGLYPEWNPKTGLPHRLRLRTSRGRGCCLRSDGRYEPSKMNA